MSEEFSFKFKTEHEKSAQDRLEAIDSLVEQTGLNRDRAEKMIDVTEAALNRWFLEVAKVDEAFTGNSKECVMALCLVTGAVHDWAEERMPLVHATLQLVQLQALLKRRL